MFAIEIVVLVTHSNGLEKPKSTGVEEEEMSVEDLEAKVKELEEMKNNSDSKLEDCHSAAVWFFVSVQLWHPRS